MCNRTCSVRHQLGERAKPLTGLFMITFKKLKRSTSVSRFRRLALRRGQFGYLTNDHRGNRGRKQQPDMSYPIDGYIFGPV